MTDGTNLKVDHPRAVAFREGVGLIIGPGGAPQIFNSESVNRVIGDLAGQGGAAATAQAAA